jgi:hypothetical protein
MPSIRDAKVDRLTVRDLDIHQHRVRNASPSELPADYVIRAELIVAYDFLKLHVDALEARIRVLEEGGDEGGSGLIEAGNVLYQKQRITSDTIVTTTYDATTEGNYLIVVLIIEEVGHQIFWDPDKFPTGPINLDVYTPGMVIVCKFVSVEGFWWLSGVPQT